MNIFVQPIDKAGSKDGVKRITAETARHLNNFLQGTTHVPLHQGLWW